MVETNVQQQERGSSIDKVRVNENWKGKQEEEKF